MGMRSDINRAWDKHENKPKKMKKRGKKTSTGKAVGGAASNA